MKNVMPLSTRSILIGLLVVLAPATKAAQPPRYVQGELLVKFKDGPRSSAAELARNQMKHDVKRNFDFIGWQCIRLPQGMTVEEGLTRYRNLPGVVAAEPNHTAQPIDSTAEPRLAALLASQASLLSEDPRFGEQWSLARIEVSNAWNVTTGSSNVVVAVLDSGINYNHEDLHENMWRNPGEIPANGVDDDANGYVDDVYGIDTADDEFGNDSDPLDQRIVAGANTFYHGTLCAGVIGAAGNNGKGIAGMNWSVQLMAIRAIRATNWISGAEELEALEYCLLMKQRGVNLKIINMSYFLDEDLSQALSDAHDAIGNAGILQVVAAGNFSTNNDVSPIFPASYLSPGLIAVANSDQNDNLWPVSNYGPTNVDLAAPGRGILTTSGPATNAYATFNGTSAACPHVAGAAALLFAAYPSATAEDVKAALLQTVDLLPAFTNKVVSHGRLNIGRAMQALSNGPPVVDRYLHVPAQYATIQAAVDAAASGDTVRIAAGHYYEQILIADKGTLTLAGEPGTVIHATTNMRQILEPFNAFTFPIIGMVRSQVTISGITFEGERLGNAYPGTFWGIIFRGSSGRVENCTIRGFRGVTATDARAINVINALGLADSTVDIAIINSTFADNYRSIVLLGDEANPALLRIRFTIENNSFTGFGPGSDQPSHLGLFIVTGAGGIFRENTVTGYSYSGPDLGFSGAVFAHDSRFQSRGFAPVQPLRFEGNRFLTNDQSLVLVAANDSQVVSNVFQGVGSGVVRWGSVAVSGTNVLVKDNDFSDQPIGIELFGGDFNGPRLRGVATNPKLFGNRFCTVAEPVWAQPLANGIDEQGTQICQDPSPPARTLNVPVDYPTIQAAVNAAVSGDTVRIAAGEYHEQIVIANKGRLTLTGETGAVVLATTGMTETLRPYNWTNFPLLGIYRSEVAISGLVLDGGQLGDLYPTLIGIYYLGAGGTVRDCVIREFRGSGSSASGAIGIYTDNSVKTGSSSVTMQISDSRFENNELSIQLRGDPVDNPTLLRNTFVVEGNTVVGWGPMALAIDGIAIRNGVSGEVRRNIIRDHDYTGGGDPFSSGIAAHDGRGSVRGYFAPLFPVRYEGNRFLNNDEHLLIIGGNESQVINNIFHGSGPSAPRWGGLAISGTNIVVSDNDFSGMPTGIVLFGNDAFFSGWPAISPATNPRLQDNWFCNVPEPLNIRLGATGVQEHGTQSCPFRPILQSMSRDAASSPAASFTLRSWHAQPVLIETSTDLQTWSPLYTNSANLPRVVYGDAIATGEARRFYRAVQR